MIKKTFFILLIILLILLGIYFARNHLTGSQMPTQTQTSSAPAKKSDCPECKPCNAGSQACPPREPPILMPHNPPSPVLTTPEEGPCDAPECPKTPPDLSEKEIESFSEPYSKWPAI
jgi:hypothetical protein